MSTDGIDLSREPYIPDKEFEAELRGVVPAPSVDAVSIATSYGKLNDRQFEVLLACLFKARGAPVDVPEYDDVQLLRPGADGGRDIALIREGRPVGAVQCKNQFTSLDRPSVIRELSRFLLSAKLEPRIMPNAATFTYVLVASGGISGKAQELFHETARVLDEEEALVRQCASEVVSKYKSFQMLDEVEASDFVLLTLRKVNLRLITSDDLDVWLHASSSIYSHFFAARLVVDKSAVDALRRDIANIDAEASRRGRVALDRWRHPIGAVSVVSPAPGVGSEKPIVLDDVYVTRTMQSEVDTWVSRATPGGEGALVAVVAPGGYGKTSLLWDCHRRYSSGGNAEAFLFTASLVASLVMQDQFDESLGALTDHVRRASSCGGRVLVCLDTFDVLAHDDNLLRAGLKLIRELLAAGASIIVTSRPEEMARIPIEQLASCSARLYLDEYDEREFEDAVASHCRSFYRGSGISSTELEEQVERLKDLVALGRPIKEVCLNPLTLRMLFELYAPDRVPEDINSFRLYSEYWIARVISDRRAAGPGPTTGRNLAAAAHYVAARMFAAGTPLLGRDAIANALASGDLRAEDLSDLISRNLLVRSEAGAVEFFHQTFFEHAAARHLAASAHEDVKTSIERLDRSADDGFRLPVYEQLFLLVAAGLPAGDPVVEAGVRDLLERNHPGLHGVGLHAHMLSPSGYATGRLFVLRAARERDQYVLKRVCRLINNLPKQRAGEVRAIIAAAWEGAEWGVLDLLARLFIWLAQADWAACREELALHDLVGQMHRSAPNSSVDAERWIVRVLQHGVSVDSEWVVRQSLRCVRNKRHVRQVLEFLGDVASRLSDDAARLCVDGIVSKAAEAPLRDSDMDPPANCLAAMWDAHPTLAPTDAAALRRPDDAATSLRLRALAQTHAAPIDRVKMQVLHQVEIETEPGVLYALLQRFAVPALARSIEAQAPVARHLVQIWASMLRGSIDGVGRFDKEHGVSLAQVVASATKALYAQGAIVPQLVEVLLDIRVERWLGPGAPLYLLPIAVAEDAMSARAAFEAICQDPVKYGRHASILKGALPSFAKTPKLLRTVVRLARATRDPQFVFAFFDKAVSSGEMATLLPVAREMQQPIEEVALAGIEGRRAELRTAGYLLLATMVRQGVMLPPPHADATGWFLRERRPEARGAVIQVLQAATSTSEAEATALLLIRSAAEHGRSSFNQTVDSLRAVLSLPGVHLSESARIELMRFALSEGAIEPQVSIAGRVIDICCSAGEVWAAHEAALEMLRSDCVKRLSVTQRRSLGHHLDKPFLSLYRKLDPGRVAEHVALLSGMDPYMGRLVVTSLCKSDRPDVSISLSSIMADERVHPELKRIIQDYRQILWKK